MPGIIIGIVCAFLVVILVRTLRFTPKAQPVVSGETVSVDGDAAVHALAELVKCKTISYYDHSKEDMAIFRIDHMSNAEVLDAPAKDYHTVSSMAKWQYDLETYLANCSH